VPVGNEKEALIFVLQLHPVLQDPVIVTEMQTPGGTHAGQDTGVLRSDSSQNLLLGKQRGQYTEHEV
jgi:hypothetical protein